MDADLSSHYSVDSLRALRILSTVEVELGIEFPEGQMRNIRTLNHVKNLCEQLLKAKA